MAGVDKNVQPVIDWLDKWESPESKSKRRTGRSSGASAIRRMQRMLNRRQRQKAAAIHNNLMKAMRQSTPENPALVPGPGLIPFGDLPKPVRDSMPAGRWIGLDPGDLDKRTMNYLMNLK